MMFKCHHVPVARITTSWIKKPRYRFLFQTRTSRKNHVLHAPGEAPSLVKRNTEFMKTTLGVVEIMSQRLLAMLHTRNKKYNAGDIRALLIRTTQVSFELKCSS